MERYTQLNAELQRRARQEAFLNEQCKEIEGNNIMVKTRDLFKKIGDTRETFHAKMGTIKDRNDKDLTVAKGIQKTWQEYTELYHKGLNDLDNQDGSMVSVKSYSVKSSVPQEALLQTKLVEVMEFQLSYFKS